MRALLARFAEMIPLASETSRLEWTDIWGRRFRQPVRTPSLPLSLSASGRTQLTASHPVMSLSLLCRRATQVRSVFTDIAPLPGPLRNFMMTTTFEVLRTDSSHVAAALPA